MVETAKKLAALRAVSEAAIAETTTAKFPPPLSGA